MAFLQVSDTKKKLDVTLFPDTYRQLGERIKEKGIYYLSGKVQERDGRLQLVLAYIEEATTERFWIKLAGHEHDREISHVLQKYPGNIPVVLRYEDEKRTISAPHFRVEKSEQLQEELKNYTMKTIFR